MGGVINAVSLCPQPQQSQQLSISMIGVVTMGATSHTTVEQLICSLEFNLILLNGSLS